MRWGQNVPEVLGNSLSLYVYILENLETGGKHVFRERCMIMWYFTYAVVFFRYFFTKISYYMLYSSPAQSKGSV